MEASSIARVFELIDLRVPGQFCNLLPGQLVNMSSWYTMSEKQTRARLRAAGSYLRNQVRANILIHELHHCLIHPLLVFMRCELVRKYTTALMEPKGKEVACCGCDVASISTTFCSLREPVASCQDDALQMCQTCTRASPQLTVSASSQVRPCIRHIASVRKSSRAKSNSNHQEGSFGAIR